jgi:predicted KAP-like P-loop ATPase
MTWLRALRGSSRDDKRSHSGDSKGAPAATDPKTERGQPGIRTDNPIRQSEEDTLGREKTAGTFPRQVLKLDASEGVVVGVLGPWGSGKTSFVNLARAEFDRAGVPILDFNPWMFSGAQQLVDSFFVLPLVEN